MRHTSFCPSRSPPGQRSDLLYEVRTRGASALCSHSACDPTPVGASGLRAKGHRAVSKAHAVPTPPAKHPCLLRVPHRHQMLFASFNKYRLYQMLRQLIPCPSLRALLWHFLHNSVEDGRGIYTGRERAFSAPARSARC